MQAVLSAASQVGAVLQDYAERGVFKDYRATVTPRLREGVVSLELTLADGDFEYGTRKLVNLAHETFLFLSEYWADYMWQNFELNME